MAGEISVLAALTGAAAAPTDLIEVVDVSDTTMAVTGTNKKMPLADLAVSLYGQPRIGGVEYRIGALKGCPATIGGELEQVGNVRVHLSWLPGCGDSLTYIAINVSGGGDAASRIRLGVYTVNPVAITPTTDPTPLVGPLLADSGLIDASTTGYKALGSLSIPVPPQGLWLAHHLHAPTTSPTIRCLSYNGGPGNDVVGIGGAGDFRGGSLSYNLAVSTDALTTQPTGVALSAGSLGWQNPDWIVKFA